MENRLESIELQGVKTFATTTRLEFPGKITAIVGPNGSGKSNIADAIRWVLGEQSFSLLRAKKTEDMIFSGSQQRSRSGMASSTITFNNEDGWLPIDYSHVAITRQAYRDGQNEYILTGQKVRLKDISELLSQTGMSERNYTIIGQGLVDAALALRPDERRKLFEEAAGIGLYRSRKEDSLRKLENTRKNLDRVLDILAEIKPRLRSLERQALRFQEYQQVKTDLRLLLREWYGFQWHVKQQDLRKTRDAFHEQEVLVHSLSKLHLDAKTNVEEARARLQAYRKDLESFYGELSENHSLLEQTTRELAIIEERQRSYKQQKDNLNLDISNIEEEIKGIEAQGLALKAEIEQRQEEFHEGAEEERTFAQKLADVIKEREQIDSALDKLREKRIQLETEKVQTVVRIDELENRVNALQNEHDRVENANETLQHQRNEANEHFILLEKNSQTFTEKIEQQKNEIDQFKHQIERLNHDHLSITQQINHKDNQRTKLSTQLSLLLDAEKALSGYSEGSKKLLENARQGRLPQGIEPISQHILIDEQYERAISAALGELTDLLAMPSQAKDKLIEYLEAKADDRVALMPLDQSAQVIHKNDFHHLDGVIGFANTLVSVEKTYQNLVDSLLADILVVKDTETAEIIIGKSGLPIIVVTLSGIVFYPNGMIISGQSPSGKRIGRTRQQAELQSERVLVENEIEELLDQQMRIEKYIEQLQAEQDELVQDFALLEREWQVNEAKLQDARDAQARLLEQQRWNSERLLALDADMTEVQSMIESGKRKLVAIDGEINRVLGEEKKINIELQAIPLFEIQQTLNQLKTQQIVAKNTLNSVQQRYQDISNRADVSKQRFQGLINRRSEIATELVEIEERKGELTQKIEEIQLKINHLESEHVGPLSTIGVETEQSILELQQIEAQSHQRVIIAERQYTQLQMELERRQDQLNLLRDRIGDDFGLVSFESDQKYDGPRPLPFNDDLIEDLPQIAEIPESHEDDIKRLKGQLLRIGAVNPEAEQEYIEVKERFEFLTNQVADLEKASQDLQKVIEELDDMMEIEFVKTYQAVNKEFSAVFSRLFNGGEAKLIFTDEENPVEGGVDIEVRLPGRRQQGLASLSGGERSLTAVALIFALLKVSPPPFCILDEVDAMLDESNVGRFVEELRELSKQIQVVIITHNRNTVQAADVIYGVTMGRDSTSQMISLKLDEVGDAYFA